MRSASCNIAGVRLPMTIFVRAMGLFGIALSHRNGSRGLTRESGERALVSCCYINFLTCVGSLRILPVMGSRMAERFVGAVCFVVFCPLLRFQIWILGRPLVFLRTFGEVPSHICCSGFCWHV